MLSGTGLALWPFLKMLYDNWRSPAESSSSEAPGSLESVQRMKWALFFKIFMLAMAVVPLSNMATTNTAYEQRCGDQVFGRHTFGNTGTTHDAVLAGSADPDGSGGTSVPILFHLALKISYGMNSYVSANMPCLGDVRAIDAAIHNLYIGDQALKEESNLFNAMCYGLAKDKLEKALRGTGDLDTDQAIRDKWTAFIAAGNSPSDVNSPISKFFEETPGFYAPCNNSAVCRETLRATKPIPGFDYADIRDRSLGPDAAVAGIGAPTCSEWYTSIRPRIATAAKLRSPVYDNSIGRMIVSATEGLSSLITNRAIAAMSDRDREIYIARQAYNSDRPIMMNSYGEKLSATTVALADRADRAGLSGDVMTGVAAILAGSAFSMIPGVGDVSEQIAGELASTYVNMYIIKQGAPMMKALVLMMIYGLLALYLVISEYEVGSVITAMVLVMVVNLFSSIFMIANYLESALFMTMYPGTSITGSVMRQGIKYFILDFELMMMYFIAPALMLYMVQMAGQRIRDVGSSGDKGTQNIGAMGGRAGGRVGEGFGKASRGARGAVRGRGKG